MTERKVLLEAGAADADHGVPEGCVTPVEGQALFEAECRRW